MSEGGALEDVIEGLNTTLNGTAAGSGAPVLETVWDVLKDVNFLLLEAKLVSGAIGIIYVASHASLRRPPSAAKARSKKARGGRGGAQDDDDDDDDDNEDGFAQGLELSDAIMFPLLAGCMLIGLYYLLQWLQDPEILNKILRWYMSSMSLVSLLTLFSHGFELVASYTFPRYWRDLMDGFLRIVDQERRSVQVCDDVGNVVFGQVARPGSSPLPGIWSKLPLSERTVKLLWDARGLLHQQWLLKFYAHGFGHAKTHIKLSHVFALLASVVTTVVYNSTSSPFLSNTLGYGLCYGSLLLISPTNLLIGSLVLIGLFFYDITMVFYTPYMVTVATKLDVPIKLQFEAASRRSILGLGDIVLPGILMAFALRLDLWLHYQRKLKYESTKLELVQKDASTGQITTTTETKFREVKVPYVNVKNGWGERFWASDGFFANGGQLPSTVAATSFPKTYFHATVLGYAAGMGVTLAMLLVFKRGQPALLYLVPGVLGSLYLRAFTRGELKLIWGYTEDGSIDTIDTVVNLDADGRVTSTVGELKDGIVDTTRDDKAKEKAADDQKKPIGQEEGTSVGAPVTPKKNHHVFLLSLEVPPEAPE